MGVVRVTWHVFLYFAPNHIFGVGETNRHFKCRVLTDKEVYKCMSGRLPPKGCVQGHVTFKFWEISDNISETVQDRNMVAMDV